MDLARIERGESFNIKRYIYVEVDQTTGLHLEQTDHHARTLIAPYGIRKRMSVYIRIIENLNHHPNKGMKLNERGLAFSRGLKNFFISTSSQTKTKEVRMPVKCVEATSPSQQKFRLYLKLSIQS